MLVELEFSAIVKAKAKQRLSTEGASEAIEFDDFEEFWHDNENKMRAANHERSQVDMHQDSSRRILKIENGATNHWT